jgi:hypothetical protein
MSTNELLANVKVASPCTARWGHMIGDERARFCAQCQKHVYNLSAMTAREAADLIREKEGKLCARFYRRADGTVLTSDCPLGAGLFWRRVKRVICGTAAILLLGGSASLLAHSSSSSREREVRARGKLALLCEDSLWRIKGWLGINPRPATMGDVCVSPPTAATNPPSARQ